MSARRRRLAKARRRAVRTEQQTRVVLRRMSWGHSTRMPDHAYIISPSLAALWQDGITKAGRA